MARTYEQNCGLASGLDVIGERWTLLIVRELLYGAKRFSDLMEGLPGIPPSLLSTRLKELQESGIIAKGILPPPAAATVYRLTEAGRELEDILYALGRWGTQFGRCPAPDDAARAEWVAFSLRCAFRPEAAADVHDIYELRLRDGTLHLEVDDGLFTISDGQGQKPDLILSGDTGAVMDVLMGRQRAEDVRQRGLLKIEGDRAVLTRMVGMFRLLEPPASDEPTDENQPPRSMLELLAQHRATPQRSTEDHFVG